MAAGRPRPPFAPAGKTPAGVAPPPFGAGQGALRLVAGSNPISTGSMRSLPSSSASNGVTRSVSLQAAHCRERASFRRADAADRNLRPCACQPPPTVAFGMPPAGRCARRSGGKLFQNRAAGPGSRQVFPGMVKFSVARKIAPPHVCERHPAATDRGWSLLRTTQQLWLRRPGATSATHEADTSLPIGRRNAP